MIDVLGEPIDENQFKFEIGEDVLEEMILGYKLENIIEELIQNDYDAKSPMTEIRFTNDKLVVDGFGAPIDENGWKRLKKILGTGKGAPPKKSKLGIKNMGLRALFLIGDYIRIKSAGKRAILSLTLGTNVKDEPTFARKNGVHIEVPYRAESYKIFSIFNIEKEKQLCMRISEILPYLLIKLPSASTEKVLQSVRIVFERLGITLECEVAVRKLKSKHRRTGPAYRRSVKFIRTSNSQQGSEGIEPFKKVFREIEFFEKVDVTKISEEQKQRIPDYFLPRITDKGLSLYIGISIPIGTKGKIDKSIPGRFFYPIGLDEAFTGNCFSINAPFSLNDTRDRLIENDFNDELIQHAARKAYELLKVELLPLFGSEAYDVLIESDNNGLFIKTLFAEIIDGTALINNRYVHGSKRLSKSMFLADKRYLPCSSDKTKISPDLYGFIFDSKLLSSTINPQVAIILLKHKIVEPFTIQDVVNLMVNDEEAIRNNKISGWHFTSESDYKKELKDVDKQKKYLDAIANHIEELKAKDKEFLNKLKASRSLLNANRELSNWNLYIFQGLEGDFKGFDKGSIIHPALRDLKLFKKHKILQKYDISKEIIDRYIPLVQKGLPEKEKRRFLYFILDNIDFLKGKKCVVKLKALEIFPDENNVLCTFDKLYHLEREVKDAFGKTLRYPARVLLQNPIFIKVFKARKRIAEADIVRRAMDIRSDNPNIRKKDSIIFEKFLARRKLSKGLLVQLKPIFHTIDTNNDLVRIARAYENSKYIHCLIGLKDVHYVKGPHISFYRRLGMNTKPKFTDLMRFLRNMRTQQKPIQYPQYFYIELARAIQEEKIQPGEYSKEDIISVNGGYFIPKKVFVNPSRKYKDDFGEFRAYFMRCSKVLKESLIKMGCTENPSIEDYKDLLKKIAERCQEMSPDNFRRLYRKRVHELYERRDLRNIEFEDTDEIILTDTGVMVSIRLAKEGKVVINDNDSISAQLKTKGIYLADPRGLEGETFLRDIGVRRISEIFKPVTVDIIGELENIGKYDMQLVRRLANEKFIKAVRAVLLTQFKHKSQLEIYGWEEKFRKISEMKICNDIISTYVVDRTEIFGHEEVCLKEGCIYIVKRLKREKLQKLSHTISLEILGTNDESRYLSLWIMHLLEVSNPKKFLGNFGISGTKGKARVKSNVESNPLQNDRTGLIDPANMKSAVSKAIRTGGGGAEGAEVGLNRIMQWTTKRFASGLGTVQVVFANHVF